MKKSNENGFTLIEVATVVIILVVLSSIIVSSIAKVIENNKKSQCEHTRRAALLGYERYLFDGGKIDPLENNDFDFLYEEGYVDRELICISGGNFTWKLSEDDELSIECDEHGDDEHNSLSLSIDDFEIVSGEWTQNADGSLYAATGSQRYAELVGSDDTSEFSLDAEVRVDTSKKNGEYEFLYFADEQTMEGKPVNALAFSISSNQSGKTFFNCGEYDGSSNKTSILRKNVADLDGFEDFNIQDTNDINITVVDGKHTLTVNGKVALVIDESQYSGNLDSGKIYINNYNKDTSSTTITEFELEKLD